jgi:hypothetical protein
MTLFEKLTGYFPVLFDGAKKGLKLNPWWAVICLGPLLVYFVSEWLLIKFGAGFNWLPAHFAEYDGSREMAARLNVLGALLLLVASASASLIYFVMTLVRLQLRDILIVGAIVGASFAGLGISVTAAMKADKFAGSPLMCASQSYNAKLSRAWKPTQAADKPPEKDKPVKVPLPESWRKQKCADQKLAEIRLLQKINVFAVLIGLLSLIAGSIACLSRLPDENATEEQELAHYERQSQHLNGYLYLSALLLVSGLIFVAAMLRWPTYALIDASSYESHVNALTAYYGVTYTILIAAFYIPVALILTERVRAHKKDGPGGSIPDAFKGPLQIFKIASALFSTTFAGIASSLISLGG